MLLAFGSCDNILLRGDDLVRYYLRGDSGFSFPGNGEMLFARIYIMIWRKVGRGPS
jgi:hypothetical protein